MSTPTRAKETSGRWGKKDTEDFCHYVDGGFINIDNCVAGYIESVRVDPRCRRFATRSKLSFRDNYKNITADLRLERELRGGQGSKFFVFCVVYCHVSHPLTILQTAAAATTAATAATDDNEGESVGNLEGEDDKDNEDLLSDMGPKKFPAAAAAAPRKAPAKSGNVDALANLLQGASQKPKIDL